MSNEDRLASLLAKAELAMRPDVETESMLQEHLSTLYLPIFNAVTQINNSMHTLSAEYGVNLYHVRVDLQNRMWVQRLNMKRSSSVYVESILTLWPSKANLVLPANQQHGTIELAQFTPATADTAVAAIFAEAEKFFGR